jgi:hypothetical protein
MLLATSCVAAEQISVHAPNMSTPVKSENLDPATFAEWENGVEKTIPNEGRTPLIEKIIWNEKRVQAGELSFGDSRTPGVRYLRVGFKTPVPVGSVLVRGGGSLSVLKPAAPYPGVLNDDSQWIPALRLEKGVPTHAEVVPNDYALWVLPPNTNTRALRFSHTAQNTDMVYRGRLSAAVVLSERLMNLAPHSLAAASCNPAEAKRLVNEYHDAWKSWENFGAREVPADAPVISSDHPESAMLVWPAPVKLSGLAALWPGFSAATVQIYTGPATQHPREAAESDWSTLGSYSNIISRNFASTLPNRLDFGQVVTTRAVRLTITAPPVPSAEGGKRIWLDELMALSPLDDAPLQAVSFPVADDGPQPPIPVRFNLKKAGFVTLVIEDTSGKRVRNLVSETPFPAGDNTIWWDGTDDLGRDVDAARRSLYKIPARFVAPGDYRVRGLVRDKITPHYEFSVYNPGTPPWTTADETGGWLTNHSAPQAALYLPAEKTPNGKEMVYLGSYISEGGSGLAWVDLEGRKQGGRGWIGGAWTAAPFLAGDFGTQAVPDIYAYVGAVWFAGKDPKSTQLVLRITGLTTRAGVKDIPIASYEFTGKSRRLGPEMGGFAVRDGIVVASLTLQNQLIFVDARNNRVLGTAPLDAPKGLAFDARGRLLAVSGTKLVRFDKAQLPLANPGTLIATGLDDPGQITLDVSGNIYISDRGQSHQVKVFDANGRFVRAIGKAGVPKEGPYDPLRMNNPAGLAVDSRNRLWVTENDFLPKRVSVWSLDGKLLKAFYGPGKYGGGGTLDPQDKTRFYYADEGRGTLEFKLDWQKGEAQLVNVLYRPEAGDLELSTHAAAPEMPLYFNGKRYFTDCYNSDPTSGQPVSFIFAEKAGVLRPIAALGWAGDWPILDGEAFQARRPQPPAPEPGKKKGPKPLWMFVWSDANFDGQVQPMEVDFQLANIGGITVAPDLSFYAARVNGQALRYAPTGFSAQGVPKYDLAKAQILANGVLDPASSGGSQIVTSQDGWMALTLGQAPYSALSITGAKNGVAMWSYPNLWPGLHASHHAPDPTRPGELTGPTRMLGGPFSPRGSEVGPLWALNSNEGQIYIFTIDGLFAASVFQHRSVGKIWRIPTAERNLDISELTLGEENFWPTITQTSDGEIYIVDGARMALVRLDGLDTLRRIPEIPLKVTAGDLMQAQKYLVTLESQRQKEQGTGILKVAVKSQTPVVDGTLDDWKSAQFVAIDAVSNGASGAVAVAGDRLYAAWKTGDGKLLQNSGELPAAPFKTGGALDLMIGADAKANPGRANPVAGDVRLLVTQANGKTLAVLYRAVVPGTKEPVPFSSPWRTITLDKVDDVSAQVQLAGKDGNYEISIPLSVLGLQPATGQTISGDIGILRGDGAQTTSRTYWSNKASNITADVPSEAQLAPQLWGKWQFVAAN